MNIIRVLVYPVFLLLALSVPYIRNRKKAAKYKAWQERKAEMKREQAQQANGAIPEDAYDAVEGEDADEDS